MVSQEINDIWFALHGNSIPWCLYALSISPTIFAFELPSTRYPLNLSNALLKFPSWIADSTFRAACKWEDSCLYHFVPALNSNM